MADRDGSIDLRHDRLELFSVVEPEGFGDGADLFVSIDQCIAVGAKTGHAGRELTTVLHIEQHSRNEPRHAVDVAGDWREG